MSKLMVTLFFALLTSFGHATVFKETGAPKESLLGILDALYMPHKDENISIFEAVCPFLRKTGLERKDLKERELSYEQKTKLIAAFEDLGFVKEVRPEIRQVDDLYVFGSLAPELKLRLEYLVTLWNRGLRFERLIFLTGERLRDASESDRQIFFSHKRGVRREVCTECDIMVAIWEQIDKPEELEAICPLVINAPRAAGESRPNTVTTAEELIKSYGPLEGSWIAITNQPYVPYQEAVLKRLFPKTYVGAVVGPRSVHNILCSIYLDTLARTVHNEFWARHPQ